MKSIPLWGRFGIACVGLTIVFNSVVPAFSQDGSNTLPVVTLKAPDESASESGDPGLFTLFRDGPTNNLLHVYLVIGGSASNGVDYASIPQFVDIPAGVRNAAIPVHAINDSLVEGIETVALQLAPPPLGAPLTYNIGWPSNAVVNIVDNDSTNNLPPSVRIITPTNNASFTAPANITICAEAADLDDYVFSVQFFAGTNSLGIRTNCLPCASPLNPFCLMWSNVPPGEYTLTAKATDSRGATRTSDPVHIVVRFADLLPTVTIRVTDSSAAESLDNTNRTGVFTVTRSANIDYDLTVYYVVGGTASNGVDYVHISDAVKIPAGHSSAQIVIDPIDDNLPEDTESVMVGLISPLCAAMWPPPPGCYQVGYPASAVLFIADNDHITNSPPKVHILSPTNGSAFVGPLNLDISAEATDSDDAVVRVDFFAGDHFVGRDLGTNKALYSVTWSNALPGLYALQARAFDSRGAVGASDLVRISITGTNPPPTNLPPVVTIFAADSIAAEGTNWCTWYSNSTSPFPDHWPCTNNALFVVRRSGPTNASLLVNYAIGGSASNGVDYLSIPNSITIPAGERSMRIPVTPIDDTLVECNETVVLKLLEDTNSPSYLVGWPGKAAAVIVDNDRPLPDTTLLCDGTFHMLVPTTNGFTYRLECSLDLLHWISVGTNTVTDLGVHFVDPESPDYPNRYYRVVPETAAPLQ
jgi:hypothetical protein